MVAGFCFPHTCAGIRIHCHGDRNRVDRIVYRGLSFCESCVDEPGEIIANGMKNEWWEMSVHQRESWTPLTFMRNTYHYPNKWYERIGMDDPNAALFWPLRSKTTYALGELISACMPTFLYCIFVQDLSVFVQFKAALDRANPLQ